MIARALEEERAAGVAVARAALALRRVGGRLQVELGDRRLVVDEVRGRHQALTERDRNGILVGQPVPARREPRVLLLLLCVDVDRADAREESELPRRRRVRRVENDDAGVPRVGEPAEEPEVVGAAERRRVRRAEVEVRVARRRIAAETAECVRVVVRRYRLRPVDPTVVDAGGAVPRRDDDRRRDQRPGTAVAEDVAGGVRLGVEDEQPDVVVDEVLLVVPGDRGRGRHDQCEDRRAGGGQRKQLLHSSPLDWILCGDESGRSRGSYITRRALRA